MAVRVFEIHHNLKRNKTSHHDRVWLIELHIQARYSQVLAFFVSLMRLTEYCYEKVTYFLGMQSLQVPCPKTPSLSARCSNLRQSQIYVYRDNYNYTLISFHSKHFVRTVALFNLCVPLRQERTATPQLKAAAWEEERAHLLHLKHLKVMYLD